MNQGATGNLTQLDYYLNGLPNPYPTNLFLQSNIESITPGYNLPVQGGNSFNTIVNLTANTTINLIAFGIFSGTLLEINFTGINGIYYFATKIG